MLKKRVGERTQVATGIALNSSTLPAASSERDLQENPLVANKVHPSHFIDESFNPEIHKTSPRTFPHAERSMYHHFFGAFLLICPFLDSYSIREIYVRPSL